MATRKEKCICCSTKLRVPVDTQSIQCPACGSVIVVSQRNSAYTAPPATNQYNGYYQQPSRLVQMIDEIILRLMFLSAFTGDSAGALTYSFIYSVENEPNLTYGSLLNSMRNRISEAQRRLGEPPQV